MNIDIFFFSIHKHQPLIPVHDHHNSPFLFVGRRRQSPFDFFLKKKKIGTISQELRHIIFLVKEKNRCR